MSKFRVRKGFFSKNLERKSSPGYVLLISILFVGVISMTIIASLLLFSNNATRSSRTLEESTKSLALAQTCAEKGLLALFEEGGYGGGELITFDDGTCEILLTGGVGNEERTLCVEGISGDSYKRFEILIRRIRPSIQIYSWQEVVLFSSCDYP